MEPKQIVILLLGIMVIPVVLIVVGVSNWIILDQDDLLVASEYDYTPTGENVLKSYYQQTYICDNTFTFDSVTFTHKNYAKLSWKPYNSTHYQLNISMVSQERTPSGYILFGANNRFDVNITVTIDGVSSNLTLNGIDGWDTNVITYFILEEMEKLKMDVDIEISNTHNSDTGDVTVYGDNIYYITLMDPSHNDGLNFMFRMLAVAGILSTLGLFVTLVVVVKKNRSYY